MFTKYKISASCEVLFCFFLVRWLVLFVWLVDILSFWTWCITSWFDFSLKYGQEMLVRWGLNWSVEHLENTWKCQHNKTPSYGKLAVVYESVSWMWVSRAGIWISRQQHYRVHPVGGGPMSPKIPATKLGAWKLWELPFWAGLLSWVCSSRGRALKCQVVLYLMVWVSLSIWCFWEEQR